MQNKPIYTTVFLIAFFLCTSLSFAQSKKQQELEDRRQELRQEIQQINSLLTKNKSQQKSQLTLIEDLNYKVSVRRNLIKVTNQQANLLTREINDNQNNISELREELATLKDNYAKMIVTSYKSKSEQSRVMFLLSSTNFQQAYKRVKYINQYAEYQKQQGEAIKTKTAELQVINKALLKQKEDKQKLINENKVAQTELVKELKQHETLMAAINKDVTKYAAQIKSRQAEANRIDKEIERIIKEAIASSNTKAGKTSTTKSTAYAMTPEDKVLANSFISSKGKLPWPVEKGVVKLRYGRQPSPIVKTIMIQSNGVRIETESNAKVRAVFNGEVYRIIASKNGNPSVLIRHGNYFTAYSNLGKIYVKKGDKVTTKQEIGEVFTNPSNGQTTLSFSVFNNSKTENPASWIYKM
ncbi:peptidoglycan DD-metalloendopeptidase family protein [Lacinutrix sp. C3R15]|uniref:murein hydrolase activator EnvC family protein n=1 Tax=Flavobacteriaceae TaxID=49546 RepID=UPI001C096FE9|nr:MULTISPECIES: peptidoglycan DD-metalloendopeptidase family protein [Flavobacteriaceae]MBU2938096.1 peptidoglycan DD-metalloendopeptidase family protein [Lacinutrix sp. C3R15]MDO6621410.1 peptidoglycan DD-metalloendopeptidase family protein [Oceanihabitans sp. 1_MG-2023]